MPTLLMVFGFPISFSNRDIKDAFKYCLLIHF